MGKLMRSIEVTTVSVVMVFHNEERYCGGPHAQLIRSAETSASIAGRRSIGFTSNSSSRNTR